MTIPLVASRWRSFLLVLTALASAGMSSDKPAVPQEGNAAGVVDQISGTWLRNSAGELSRGDLLFPSDTVRLRDLGDARLSIVLLASGKVWTQICTAEEREACKKSFRPVALRSEGGFWSFLASYWNTGERKLSPVFARTRSTSPDGPTHGLVVASGTEVDLSPVLQRVTPGSYTCEIRPAPGVTAADTGARPAHSVVLYAGRPASVPLVAGLYSLTLRGAQGQVGDSVLLYVAPAGSQAISTWKDVTARAATLGLNPGTADALLARALYALHAAHGNER